MTRLELTITALSPLAPGRQKPGGSVSEVENYISGSVLRGAIASQILQLSGQQSANLAENGGNFQTLFLGENPAIFGNAYPAVTKIDNKSIVVNQQIKVLPATAVSSKTNPGFTSSRSGHGVFDTLIDAFCATAYNQPYDPSDPKAIKEGTNPQVETYNSFYSQVDGKYYSHDASSRFLTRVGINRRRATAEEEILYSVQVLNESFLKNTKADEWDNFVFRSFVIVPHESLAGELQRFIERNSCNFRIGGSASRGLGKVKIEVSKGQAPAKSVKSRIEEFNQALHTRWKLWSIFGQPQNDLLTSRTYFTLDLQSDAILTENWQRTTVVSAEMLKDFAKVDSSLEMHVAYSSYEYRSGWNSAWGLMKDVELVTTKGSVYLFSTTEPEKWYAALEDLESKGIGDRTCEGFGQIEVCNEFHQVFRENAK
ncbi:CRISPR-associated RAMP protein Csx10 [Fischerella thermalis]|uniref:type III-D CRISPR-associated RAMP protein Csx10 n=1 Tax=Fischerella thermalis TaxID=372787 RepID=UPI000C8083D9|nr:CRISPR-associated RAMP protein Csx10 [Fischerella thermalis]PLZ05071.1 CRISPR-associated RAMP protein Csx10 [Fischerella thermalis WC119]PLZ35806.1 CRISPR-associated RAMP protein Csx10 [Fischerella thermalis WC558]PLZ49505.1 CRISPR-associated RAMP protein Csx10 [Fischerella thermalis WC442]PLZ62387.1 CRISPR-associated RAMP protein Csx10 [Fischerella thermalis WC439]PLZ71732.1 CRISPR-associated RAMP protein Csx10 [Fischerella thermalis WC245]